MGSSWLLYLAQQYSLSFFLSFDLYVDVDAKKYLSLFSIKTAKNVSLVTKCLISIFINF